MAANPNAATAAKWQEVATAAAAMEDPNNVPPELTAWLQIDFAYYLPLHRACMEGDWQKAKLFFDSNPNAFTARIEQMGNTPLGVAVLGLAQIEFIEKLVELMPPEALEIQNLVGYTALHHVATNGNTKAAEILVNKNPNLTQILSAAEETPVLVAAIYGQKEMVRYLVLKTRDEDPSPFRGEQGANLLSFSVLADLFDVGLYLLRQYPEIETGVGILGANAIDILARKYWPSNMVGGGNQFSQHYIRSILENPNNVCANALKWLVPSIKKFYDTKIMYGQHLEFMAGMCNQLASLNDGAKKLKETSSAVSVAAQLGNVDFIKLMIKLQPGAVWHKNSFGWGMLQVAIIWRQEKVFLYLKGLRWKDQFVSWTDINGNTILHLAANMAPTVKLKAVSGAALQVQRELQWYKEVEKIVQPVFKEAINHELKTPRQIFTEKHKNLLIDGEKWMKDMASSSMVVATLIATVVFAAGFTVPGGNDEDKGIPLFLNTRLYMVFAVSNALALFSSLTSLLIFLSILTARYAEDDFLKSLPQKLIIALSMLFFAIANTTIAFTMTYFIMLRRPLAWVSILIALLVYLPVTLFAILEFPLFLEMVRSTYRSTL